MINIIWVDEVGRWAWAWPVVAWACLFINKNINDIKIIKYLKDSKKLSKKSREFLYDELIELEKQWKCLLWIWIKWNNIIDEIWIKKANKIAMEDAIKEIMNKIWTNIEIEILVDWNDNYIFDQIDFKTTFIIKWDSKIDEIKAASIYAKVFRDELMKQLEDKYKWYSFESNVWYWTKKHSEWLLKHWICEIHRTYYAPIKKILDSKGKKIKIKKSII